MHVIARKSGPTCGATHALVVHEIDDIIGSHVAAIRVRLFALHVSALCLDQRISLVANPVCGPLGVAGGGNDQFLVGFQLLESSGEVRGLIVDHRGPPTIGSTRKVGARNSSPPPKQYGCSTNEDSIRCRLWNRQN
jgi:hypothetical protein